jgi:RND family efflux transporter MFP subunit
MRPLIPALALLAALAMPAVAQTTGQTGAISGDFTVHRGEIADEKAVFATVESVNVVPARARIGGTVAELEVRDGDAVTAGQALAVVADEKLLLQRASLDAQIGGLQAQLAQAQADLTRADTLYRQGAGPRTAMDQARTAMDVANAGLRARISERQVVTQQMTEGQVLAPTAGRVLTVPVTKGTVVLPGETIAMVAEQNFVLRLRVPERHAAFIKAGDPVRVDGRLPRSGKIELVYPQIEAGRVVADARVADLGSYFVGERVRVWIAAGTRQAIVVPAGYLRTRFGLDYVLLKEAAGAVEVPVQRGDLRPSAAMPEGIEILSGLHDGDVLARPDAGQ